MPIMMKRAGLLGAILGGLIFPSLGYATIDYSGGEGCCGYTPAIVAKVAESYGVDGDLAEQVLLRLSEEMASDLNIMRDSKEPACEAYNLCPEIPDEFFRVLINGALERQKEAQASRIAAANEERDSRTLLFSLLGAVMGLAGLGLGVFNALKGRTRNAPPA